MGILATLVAITVTLVVAEAALQAARRISRTVARLLAAPPDASAPVVVDERLIYRGNPLKFDHDSAGYQNDQRPVRAEIVTLGDSMTYGLSDRREAWPRLVADLTGRVYNMALPGYGPAQSLFQFDEARALAPLLVIVAPYFGNDLADSFIMSRRHLELTASLPADLVARAAARDRQRALENDLISPFRLGVDGTEAQIGSVRRWISTHVALYQLLRALKNRLAGPVPPDPLLSRNFATAAAAITPSVLERGAAPFEESGWRTIRHGRYRLQTLDDQDSRIRVGFLVMSAALDRMVERSRATGVRMLVVLVPTKESVFWPRVSDPDRYAGLRDLVAIENRLRGELTRRLTERSVEVLDLLEVLRGAEEQPYHEDLDGHLNATGNRLIATAVAARLGSARP